VRGFVQTVLGDFCAATFASAAASWHRLSHTSGSVAIEAIDAGDHADESLDSCRAVGQLIDAATQEMVAARLLAVMHSNDPVARAITLRYARARGLEAALESDPHSASSSSCSWSWSWSRGEQDLRSHQCGAGTSLGSAPFVRSTVAARCSVHRSAR